MGRIWSSRTFRFPESAAGHAPIGAEHAAIPGFGFQDRLAAFAVIEELAGIGRHRLRRAVPAGWTGDGGFQNHGFTINLAPWFSRFIKGWKSRPAKNSSVARRAPRPQP